MKESVGHEFLEFPRDFHKGVHLFPPRRVPFFVILQDIASRDFTHQIIQKGH